MLNNSPISTRCLDSKATGLRTPLDMTTYLAWIAHGGDLVRGDKHIPLVEIRLERIGPIRVELPPFKFTVVDRL